MTVSTGVFTLVVAVSMVVGTVAHEATHYITCRAVGAPARPAIHWGEVIPNPAIRTDLRAHTPSTYRMVTLAPLVLFVPSFVGGIYVFEMTAFGTGLPHVAWSAWAMWTLCVFPSPLDLKMAWRAPSLDDLHDVWYGDHHLHVAAEGIV